MNPLSASASGLQRSSFEKTCAYCSARLLVTLAREAGNRELQDYACPECGKTYEVRAALEPAVQLISPRGDGKRDRYQDTMF